jgi:hypothetical protein
MIGIDVDHYGDKRGADHLAAVEKELGELPPAPYSTSRGAGPSGIRLYRIPAGLEFPGKPCDDVEFIQRHHRTVVAAPSVHKSGRVYEWHSNDPRLLVHGLPTVDTVPDLPPHWVEYFRKDRPRDARQHVTGTTNNTVSKAVEAALGRRYLNAPGGRHDAMCAAVLALARLDDSEHPGAGDALARIRGDFIQRVTTEGTTRTPAGAEKEFDDAVESARALSERRPRRDRRTTS